MYCLIFVFRYQYKIKIFVNNCFTTVIVLIDTSILPFLHDKYIAHALPIIQWHCTTIRSAASKACLCWWMLRRCSSNNAASVCGAVSVTVQGGVNFVWHSWLTIWCVFFKHVVCCDTLLQIILLHYGQPVEF